VYHSNHARGLPSHLATIVLLDHATGGIVAIVDGRSITEARTRCRRSRCFISLGRTPGAGRRRQRRAGAESYRAIRTLWTLTTCV
jgi:hypothetical protein